MTSTWMTVLHRVKRRVTDHQTLLLKLLLITILSFVVGTASAPSPTVDRTLFPHYTEFVVNLFIRGLTPKNFIVSLRVVPDLGGSTVGLCSYGPMEVKIKKGLDPLTLQRAIFHELGHCMLDMEHSADPNSIMYCRINGPMTEEMQEQLFKDYKDGKTYEFDEDVCEDKK